MRDREPNEERVQKRANPGSGQPRDAEHATRDDDRGDPERSNRPMTDDERIDEAEEESFPASDPPQQP